MKDLKIPNVKRPDILTPESKEKYSQEIDVFLSFVFDFVEIANDKIKELNK